MRIELEDEPQAALVTLAQTTLRCVLGGVLLHRGLETLQNQAAYTAQLEGLAIALPEPATLTKVVFVLELLAGACLLLGRYTRAAAFVGALDVMLLAAQHVALGDLLQTPAMIESTAMLMAACGLFMVVGSGPFGLDPVLGRWRRNRQIAKDDIWSRPPYVSHR
jgi:uncharacterized membrane protein YphA (DoxX/SURF4 family)